MNRMRSDSKARAAAAANYLNALSTPLEGENNRHRTQCERRGRRIVHPKSLFVPLLWMRGGRGCPSKELSEAVAAAAAGVAADETVRSPASMVHVHSEETST